MGSWIFTQNVHVLQLQLLPTSNIMYFETILKSFVAFNKMCT